MQVQAAHARHGTGVVHEMHVADQRSGPADRAADGRLLNVHVEKIEEQPQIGRRARQRAQLDGLIGREDGVDFVPADGFKEHVDAHRLRQFAVGGQPFRHVAEALARTLAVPSAQETHVGHGSQLRGHLQMGARTFQQFGPPRRIVQKEAVGHDVPGGGQHGGAQAAAVQYLAGGFGVCVARVGEKEVHAFVAHGGEQAAMVLKMARKHDLRHGRRRRSHGYADSHRFFLLRRALRTQPFRGRVLVGGRRVSCL